ncbi:MAG: thioredoxin family protein [Christensenellaceae bacterium]|jgi:thioredoxin 1|nr:thioredoxin family protein [Christensenellaceae bacterium]
MSETLKILTDENFQSTLDEKKLTLVDFSATWCAPCKALHPIIEEIAIEFGDVVNVCTVDVDICPVFSTNYRVMSVPTLIFFREGKVLKRSIGLIQKAEIIAMIEEYKQNS